MDSQTVTNPAEVKPLTWGVWKRMKPQILSSVSSTLGELLDRGAFDNKDPKGLLEAGLEILKRLDVFEELALTLAVNPVTDETPVGVAQIVRHQGGMAIVEAALADANFFAGLAESLGPMLGKAAAQAQQSGSGQAAGGPG